MKQIFLSWLFVPLTLYCIGQANESYTVMHYNLLFYGYYPGFCNEQNNNTDSKDQYLSTIIDYVQPDIFTVNELGQGPSGPQDPTNLYRILDNVLNATGEPRFNGAPYTNTKNSSIVNGLYYDNTKFVFYRGEVVANIVRDINLYTLYVKDEEMLLAGDTIFLHAVVAHLKAGSNESDQNTRSQEVQTVMSYINQNSLRGNVMFLADLNMKSSLEFAYQHLTFHVNQEIRFNDPINKPGSWNNSSFAPNHTQSTRVFGGCFAGGGMDDRFDQILLTSPVIDGTQGLKYVEGSYYALGQDGLRFNQSLISPPNFSAPPEVIDALYYMSDHLPVIFQLEREELASNVSGLEVQQPRLLFANPVNNSLELTINSLKGIGILQIFSLSGQVLQFFPVDVSSSPGSFVIDVSSLAPGTYILSFGVQGSPGVAKKLVVL